MRTDYKIDSEHTELIRQNYKLMVENLNVKHTRLIAELSSKDVLTLREKDELESCESSTRRIERLLSMLSRKSSNQFDAFLEALNDTGQGHIGNKIRRKQKQVIVELTCHL